MASTSRLSRRALLGGGAMLLLGGASGARAQRPRRDGMRVILISLDGFGAANLDDPRLPLPNLRRMAAEGARADRMSVITPSVTWPNHTTLVTGVWPAKHGVLANGVIEPSNGPTPLLINPRRSKEEMTRFPTLYDVAHRAGLKTAEVNWPVTRGARTLDFSFPDYPDALDYTTPQLRKELVEQKLLASEEEKDFRALGSVMRDHVWTQAAAHLIRRHRPHLLLLHLLNTDGTQHTHGPKTTEAYTALSLADRQVGEIVSAARDAGVLDQTAIFVVADHGFMRVTKQIKPNARFRLRGLIRNPESPSEKRVFDAQSIAEGGVALVYVPNGRLRPELLERTRAALQGLEGVAEVMTPEEYRSLGLPVPSRDPQAPSFLLTAKEGYSFSNEIDGEEIVTLQRPNGTHGYSHLRPEMDALFVAWGKGIRKGAKVDRIRNIDVAPTIARLMELELHDVDGVPVEAVLAGTP